MDLTTLIGILMALGLCVWGIGVDKIGNFVDPQKPCNRYRRYDCCDYGQLSLKDSAGCAETYYGAVPGEKV